MTEEWRPQVKRCPGAATEALGVEAGLPGRSWGSVPDAGCGLREGVTGTPLRSAIKRGRHLPDPTAGRGEWVSVLICFTKCETEVEDADPLPAPRFKGLWGQRAPGWQLGFSPDEEVGEHPVVMWKICLPCSKAEGRTDGQEGRHLGAGPVKRKFRSAQCQDQRIAVSQRAGILAQVQSGLRLMGSSHEYLLGASFAPHGGLATRMQT